MTVIPGRNPKTSNSSKLKITQFGVFSYAKRSRDRIPEILGLRDTAIGQNLVKR